MASAATGQRLTMTGPETALQGSPEEAWSEGEACVRGQPAVDVAWEALGHDAGWVMTGAGLGGREVEPESWVNEERGAFEDGGTLLTG